MGIINNGKKMLERHHEADTVNAAASEGRWNKEKEVVSLESGHQKAHGLTQAVFCVSTAGQAKATVELTPLDGEQNYRGLPAEVVE